MNDPSIGDRQAGAAAGHRMCRALGRGTRGLLAALLSTASVLACARTPAVANDGPSVCGAAAPAQPAGADPAGVWPRRRAGDGPASRPFT